MDDVTRSTAHRIVGRVLTALDADRVRTRHDTAGGIELVVGRHGSMPSARCVLSGSTLELRVPARARRRDGEFGMSGPVERPDGSEPVARLNATLELWRAGLSSPIGPDEERMAAAAVDGCAGLLRGAAQTFDPTWSAAAVTAFGPDVLIVLVEFGAAAPTRSRLFCSDVAHAPTGTISPELVRALGRTAGTRMHATRLLGDPRHPLPHLQIGQLPRVRIINDGDAMSTMRAVAALPHGARLVACTGE